MGFWIFMLLMALLTPLSMIGFGSYFAGRAPGKINAVFGYRTTRSMKNKNTWAFAHQYCGRLWRVSGWVMLPLSVITMLFALGKHSNIIGWVGAGLVMAQLIAMVTTIFPTERALKRTFDENGRRIDQVLP